MQVSGEEDDVKQVKLFVEDVAQGMGLDLTANQWIESMGDAIEVDSIQVAMGAGPNTVTNGESQPSWPVALLVTYRAK